METKPTFTQPSIYLTLEEKIESAQTQTQNLKDTE